ncbi:MAG: hypothetical protein HYT87_16230 [Nitrospirae bacterium]|nr:hypothetical protein [Nitrospirota bacterium]
MRGDPLRFLLLLLTIHYSLLATAACENPRVASLKQRADEYHQKIIAGDPKSGEFNLPDPNLDPKLRDTILQMTFQALKVAFQLTGRPTAARILSAEISKDDPTQAKLLVEWTHKKTDGTTSNVKSHETWKLLGGTWYLGDVQNES